MVTGDISKLVLLVRHLSYVDLFRKLVFYLLSSMQPFSSDTKVCFQLIGFTEGIFGAFQLITFSSFCRQRHRRSEDNSGWFRDSQLPGPLDADCESCWLDSRRIDRSLHR